MKIAVRIVAPLGGFAMVALSGPYWPMLAAAGMTLFVGFWLIMALKHG